MTDNSKLKNMLNPRDRGILNATAGTNWIPQDPKELILPYVEEQPEEIDRESLEFRLEKAKEVYDGYGKIIEEAREAEEEIEQQCKNVVVPLDPTKHLRVIESIRRVFPGHNGTEITFEMYKRCVQELAESSNQAIPDPFGQGE